MRIGELYQEGRERIVGMVTGLSHPIRRPRRCPRARTARSQTSSRT
jgi:hypothetical protein